MGPFRKLIDYPRWRAAASLILLSFLSIPAHAQLGTGPIIVLQPLDVSVQQGGTALISAIVAPSLTPQNFYWFFNGQPIATNSNVIVSNSATLTLDILSQVVVHAANSTNAGGYSLRLTNGVGSAVSSNATLTVLSSTTTNVLLFVTSGIELSANGFQLQLTGPPGSNFVIQASSDLRNWVSISTNPAPAGSVTYVDAAAKTNTLRFYRAFIL